MKAEKLNKELTADEKNEQEKKVQEEVTLYYCTYLI